jgi:hypothetical protein
MSESEPLSVILEAKEGVLAAKTSRSRASSISSSNDLLMQYENLLSFFKNDSCLDALVELKQFVLEHGIPESNGSITFGSDCLRARIWKLLLGVPLYFDIENYIRKFEVKKNNSILFVCF